MIIRLTNLKTSKKLNIRINNNMFSKTHKNQMRVVRKIFFS